MNEVPEDRHGNHIRTHSWPELTRQRFQVLYEKVASFKAARDLIDDLVVWPPHGKPPEHVLKNWARQVDLDEAEIPPGVRKAMETALDNYARYQQVVLASRSAAGAMRLLQKFHDIEKLTDSEAGLFTRFANASGFIHGTVSGGRYSQKEGVVLSGRLQINAGPAPKKLGPGKKVSLEPVIEGAVKELPVGNG